MDSGSSEARGEQSDDANQILRAAVHAEQPIRKSRVHKAACQKDLLH
jgi:hypothetical protein